MIAALPEFNIEVAHVALKGGFPFPSEAEAHAAARAINAALAPRDVALIDGLAYGALPQDAIRAITAPVLALCHHPLGLEQGLDPARAKALLRSEAAALALAAHVIVTSAHTRKMLIEDFGVAPSAVTTALPGTAPASRASGSGGGTTLLAVGSIIARKGFDILVEALAGLDDLDWRLRLVGGAHHAPQTAKALARLIEARGSRRPNRLARRSLGRGARRYIRLQRYFRLVVALRGLWHGAGRGARARLAHCDDDRRRLRRDRAGRRRAKGRAGRCRGATRGVAADDRGRGFAPRFERGLLARRTATAELARRGARNSSAARRCAIAPAVAG